MTTGSVDDFKKIIISYSVGPTYRYRWPRMNVELLNEMFVVNDDCTKIIWREKGEGIAHIRTDPCMTKILFSASVGTGRIVALIASATEFRVEYIINIREVCKDLVSGERIGRERRNTIFRLLNIFRKRFIETTAIENNIINDTVTYNVATADETPAQISSTGTYLYAYQLENIRWMRETEDLVSQDKLYFEHTKWGIMCIGKDTYVDLDHYKIFTGEISRPKIYMCGGGLLDATGIGKTLCILGLIASQPAPGFQEADADTTVLESYDQGPAKRRRITLPEEQLGERDPSKCAALIKKTAGGKKYIKRCTSRITCPEKDMCLRHARSKAPVTDAQFFDDIMPNNVDVLYQPKIADFQEEGSMLMSRATLVVVPTTLYQQWRAEIRRRMSPVPQMACVSTAAEYDDLTYSDILNADIVIITDDFLNSGSNRETVSEYSAGAPTRLEFRSAQKNCSYELTRDPHRMMKETRPLLNAVFWHRIVLDEGHEFFGHTGVRGYKSEFIMSLKSRYKWYMSATPFANGADLRYVCSWLLRNNVPIARLETVLEASPRLFRRNTKESVKHEWEVQEPIEDVRWLDFSENESRIYNSFISSGFGERDARLMCCHLKICKGFGVLYNACQSIEEIRGCLLDMRDKNIIRLRQREEALRMTIAEDEEQVRVLQERGLDHMAVVLQRAIVDAKNKHAEVSQRLKNEQSSRRFLENTIEKIEKIGDVDEIEKDESSDDDDCCICADDISKDDMGVTVCGHVFCWTCLVQSLDFVNHCSMCKYPLTRASIWKIDPATDGIKADGFSNLVKTHGTKMAHIVMYLKDLMRTSKEKVIVFSYFDRMLRLVHDTLKMEGLSPILCVGNVTRRNNAIKEFKFKSDARIVLLSAAHSASGVNLTQATRIVIVEPIAGEEVSATEVEAQVIGRAHRMGQKSRVTIVRFLIRNTIEEKIHKERFNS